MADKNSLAAPAQKYVGKVGIESGPVPIKRMHPLKGPEAKSRKTARKG